MVAVVVLIWIRSVSTVTYKAIYVQVASQDLNSMPTEGAAILTLILIAQIALQMGISAHSVKQDTSSIQLSVCPVIDYYHTALPVALME